MGHCPSQESAEKDVPLAIAASQEDALPVLVEVKGDVGELRVVEEQHLLQVSIANNLLPASLVDQVNNNL